MVSMYEHVGYISKALELGADGYVTKTAATKELMCAVIVATTQAPATEPVLA